PPLVHAAIIQISPSTSSHPAAVQSPQPPRSRTARPALQLLTRSRFLPAQPNRADRPSARCSKTYPNRSRAKALRLSSAHHLAPALLRRLVVRQHLASLQSP